MDHLGEKHLHQKSHDQNNPSEGCWCNGATNLREVKWVQQLLALVEETVEKVWDRKQNLPPNSSSLPHQAEPSVSRSLQLLFKGELPETILTKENIGGKGKDKIGGEGVSLAVELCDNTGKKVEEISPELKDLKVKILPLDGDFKVDNRHDWTEEEFEKHVAKPRDDKPPLLIGNSEVSLKNGVARIHGISFTDNSRHMRNGKFRLGAQLVKGLSSGGVVRPAVSEAFQVKEYRLKAEQKHPTPSPHDDLWRLANIRKDGNVYKRAVEGEVLTVLDFLQLYYTDARKLQKILNLTGEKWKQTVKNAEKCDLTNELYKYSYLDDASGDALVLDCAFKIESVTFEGQSSQPYESLEKSKKEKVCKLREAAHVKRKELNKIYASTNQTPVQAALGHLCSAEQPAAAAAAPSLSIMDYCVDRIGESTDLVGLPSYQICSTSTINNTATAQGNFEQLPACLVTGANGVNNTGLNLIADNSFYPQFDNLDFVCEFSPNMQFSDFTPADQGVIDMQQVNSVDDGCNLDVQQMFNNFLANDIADSLEHFANGFTGPSDQELFNNSSANNPATRKLKVVYYVTKAAAVFRISALQDPTSPMKKRKLH